MTPPPTTIIVTVQAQGFDPQQFAVGMDAALIIGLPIVGAIWAIRVIIRLIG